ncbi:zinc ribbon domain-containing protein [Lysobacter humi (ex Lee et al. 2017)]
MSQFRCPKCDHHLHVAGELRAAGGAFSSAFEISSEKFKYIACRACGYTEFYRADLSIGSQVVDLLVG